MNSPEAGNHSVGLCVKSSGVAQGYILFLLLIILFILNKNCFLLTGCSMGEKTHLKEKCMEI